MSAFPSVSQPIVEQNDDSPSKDLKDLVGTALQANKQYQNALTIYTERLADELAKVDKLLALADVDEDDEHDLESPGTVVVQGAKRATGPVPSQYFLNPESPFYEQAERRTRYLRQTTMHPMKQKELDALQEGVKAENYRKHAFESQQRGERIFDLPPKDILYNTEGIDWERIAEKVTAACGVPRTATECRVRWLGDRHPLINHDPWQAGETESLKRIVSALPEGQVNWTEVAEKLGTRRTALDCMRNASTRVAHVWDADSDARLVKYVGIYGKDNWNLVAMHVSENATAPQCQSRYFRTLDSTLTRGAWTAAEDKRLSIAVAAYGNSWTDVAGSMPGRTNEQCRERWGDVVNPDMKRDKWTSEEDSKLLEAYSILGPKWKAISEQVGGRTDRQCRTRYLLLLKQPQSQSLSELTTSAQPVASTSQAANVEIPISGGVSTPSSSAPEDNAVTTPAQPIAAGNPHAASRTRRRPSTAQKAGVTANNGDATSAADPITGPPSGLSGSTPLTQLVPKPKPRPRPRARPVAQADADTTSLAGDAATEPSGDRDGVNTSAGVPPDKLSSSSAKAKVGRPRAGKRKSTESETATRASPIPGAEATGSLAPVAPTRLSTGSKARGRRRTTQGDVSSRPSKKRRTGRDGVDDALSAVREDPQAPTSVGEQVATEPSASDQLAAAEQSGNEGSTPRRSQRPKRGLPSSTHYSLRGGAKPAQPVFEGGAQASAQVAALETEARLSELSDLTDVDDGPPQSRAAKSAVSRAQKTRGKEPHTPSRRQPRRSCTTAT